MIRIYLVRHGIAVDREPWAPSDAGRPLTDKGRRKFRRAARAFAKLDESISAIVSSPLVRAVQTAEILAEALDREEVRIADELGSGAEPARVLARVAGLVGDEQGLALVGHEPQMSGLVALLANLAPAEAQALQFRKGAIVRIDVADLPGARPSRARYWFDPRAREKVDGLPLSADGGEE